MKVRKEELGEMLHTALRKFCDSTPTSVAWNLIALDACSAAWDEYVEIVWPKIRGTADKDLVWKQLKAAGGEWPGVGDHGDHARAALRCTFRMFSDDDWKQMAGYLG